MLTDYSKGPYEIKPYNTASVITSDQTYRIWDRIGKKWVGPESGLQAIERVLWWLNEWPNPPKVVGAGLPVIKTSELQIGDTVIPTHGGTQGWDTQIVKAYNEQRRMFKLYRPYGTTDSFTVSGPSVICYMGLEEYEVFEDSDAQWFLLRRQELK